MNRKEHSSLSEELQHLRDSLLRDTNRGMDQQRVIEKMKAERRETICVQAHQRQELERDLCEAEKKVKHIGYPVWFVAASRGPTFHLQWYFILFLKRTVPARNYKIRPFRTVCYNTELGYRSLQGKRKCKKKKKKISDTNFQLFESVDGTMAKEAPFSHSSALQETHFTTATSHWTLDVAKQKSIHQRLTSLNNRLFERIV